MSLHICILYVVVYEAPIGAKFSLSKSAKNSIGCLTHGQVLAKLEWRIELQVVKTTKSKIMVSSTNEAKGHQSPNEIRRDKNDCF